MIKNVVGGVLVIALVSSVAWADDFWDEKDFLEWDIREVLKLRSDSPWAKRASVKLGRGSAFTAVPGADLNTRDMTAVGSGSGSFGMRSSSETIPLVISWQSALPFKQAIVKSMVGNSKQVTSEQREYLDQEQEHYVLVIGRLPPDIAQGFEIVEDLEEKISLDCKGKDKLFVSEVRIEAARGEVYLMFPKTDPITLDDKDIELNVDIDGLSFKKKFSLKDMVVNGVLEL